MPKTISLILSFLFFILTTLPAQDITGVWTGYISTNGNQLPYELAISEEKDKLSGYSITVFTINGVENTGLKTMKIKRKKDKVTIEDGDLIGDDYSTKAKRVMLFAILSLTQNKSELMLRGNFNSRAYFDPTYKGTIHLRKKNDFSQTRLVQKLGQANLLHTLSFIQHDIKEKKSPVAKTAPAAAAEIDKRKTETIQTIFFSSDSLVLSLYDNGQVDGDTVSVVLNGETIIGRKALTASAITKTIYIPAGRVDSLQVVMYAENLGTIPPNTGLLIVQDGNTRHEVRFEGDLQRNSAIILKRKRAF